MRSAAVSDCEQSLEAMWHAYRASNCLRRDQVEIDAGVVHASLQARYYDSMRGQFLSQDPIFWIDPKQQDIRNPQNLNSYSYSIDNPINRADPSGKYVEEISRPVNSGGFLSNFSHTFLYVVPQAGENLQGISGSNMSIDTSRPFTLGGYSSGAFPTWRLTLGVDNSYDYSLASAKQSVPGIARTIVTPPAGMTSAQFDQAVAAGYSAMSTDQGWYDPTGLRRLLGVSNSNNTNTSLLTSAGVSQAHRAALSLALVRRRESGKSWASFEKGELLRRGMALAGRKNDPHGSLKNCRRRQTIIAAAGVGLPE